MEEKKDVELECPKCKADLSRERAVKRRYFSEGSYNQARYYEVSKCLLMIRPDLCTKCGAELDI